MRFWIIGNGFDLHHGLKTSYLDYKAYLCQQHNTCASKNCQIPKDKLPQEVCRNCCKGKVGNSDCPVRRFNALPRERMDETLWRDLEEACSFKINELLKRLKGFHGGVLVAPGESGADVLLSGELGFAKQFTATHFARWLDKVEESVAQKGEADRSVAIDQTEDIFLTFNYTTTLQKIYGIPGDRILPVHGCIEQVDNARRKPEGVVVSEGDRFVSEGDIGRKYLGFGTPDITDSVIDAEVKHFAELEHLNEEEKNQLRHRLSILAGSLKKDVIGNLDRVKTFIGKYYEKLLSVEEVVVAGHSLGRIDMPYFDYLADFFKCMKWRFLCYRDEDFRNVFEFCEKYKLDGCCVPWAYSKKSFLGGVPCQESQGVPCPGFSICWSNK